MGGISLSSLIGWIIFPIASGVLAWFTRALLNKITELQDKVKQSATQEDVKAEILESQQHLQLQLDDIKNQINVILQTILRK